MNRFLWPVLIFMFALSIECGHAARSKVLMVSFDGYRWDFPFLFNTPNFNRIKKNGVSALRGAKPVFVTNTFPNHFSIVTGVHPENHGIVDNNMFNSTSKDTFSIRKSSDPKWWQDGIPIWITAEAQKVKTGVYFWVGSEIEIRGRRPSIFVKYNETIPYFDRVDTVLKWLKNDGVDLALLYFSEPDSAGHSYGVHSPEFKKAVEYSADGTLGYLLDQLKKHKLSDRVNLLVVSDHGMTNFNKEVINITDYVDNELLTTLVPQSGPTVGIFPKLGVEAEVIYEKLKNASKNMKVYLKENLPENLHYKAHGRIAPLIAIADEGYLVANGTTPSKLLVGYHGYSNELDSMRPAFAATGPAFKKQHVIYDFNNLNIYPLLCHLLDIKPEAHNGSLESVRELLAVSMASTYQFSLISLIMTATVMLY